MAHAWACIQKYTALPAQGLIARPIGGAALWALLGCRHTGSVVQKQQGQQQAGQQQERQWLEMDHRHNDNSRAGCHAASHLLIRGHR